MSNSRRPAESMSPPVQLAAGRLVAAISSLASTPGGIEALSVGYREVIDQLTDTEQYEHANVLRAIDQLAVAVRRDLSGVMAHG